MKNIALCQNVHFLAISFFRHAATCFIRRKSSWLIACLFIVGMQTDTLAALITGKISSDSGPLVDANIHLAYTQLHSTSSDSGLFSLQNAPVGRYTLVVSHTGYQTVSYPVVTTVDDTLNIDVTLQKTQIMLPLIVVTATRSPRFSKDAPVYTSFVTSQEIADKGAVRLGNVLSEQTGLNLIADHGMGVQVQGFDPDYTLILLDGEPIIGRVAGTLDLQRFAVGNLERIEIVKGPTSSLYGSEALAGVVNLITRRPENPFLVRLHSRYATHNSADVGGEIELMRGHAGLLLFANVNRSDGYDLNRLTAEPTTPEFTNLTLQPTFTYQFGDNTDVRVGLRLNHEDQYSISAIRENGGETLLENEHRTNDSSLSTQATWQPKPGFKAQGKLYGAHFDTRGLLTRRMNDSLYSRSDFAQTYYKGEAQFDLLAGQQHLLTFGGGYIHERVEADRIVHGQQTSSNLFIFAQDEWSLHPALDLIFSSRADSHSEFATHLSPKIATLFQPIPWLQLRAAAGRGFKYPEFRQRYLDFTNPIVGYSVFGSTTVEQSLRQLEDTGQIRQVLVKPAKDQIKPEQSVGYNFGVNLMPKSYLHLRINFFRNNVRDMIDTAPIAVKSNNQRIFSYFNVDKVFTQGLESEIEITLAQGIELSFGYQFLDAKDVDIVQQIENSQVFAMAEDGRSHVVRPSDYGGLFNRSRHSGLVKASYHHEQLGLKVTARGLLRGRYGNVDRNSNQILDRHDEYLPGYALWNLTCTKRIAAFTAQFGVDNFLDKTDSKNIPSLPGRQFYTGVSCGF